MKYSPKNFRPQASASLSHVRQPDSWAGSIHRLSTEKKIKALNTNLLASRHIKNKKASLPVDVRGSTKSFSLSSVMQAFTT